MPFRTPHSAFRIRAGHTLVELLVASISGSVLLAALASAMYIASRVAYTPIHAQRVLHNTTTALDLVEELKHAIYIVEHGSRSIEFVTDDRTGDGVEDTYRYEWSGTAGDPLTKSLNRGTPTIVVEAVELFRLDYSEEQTEEQLEVLNLGAEEVIGNNSEKSGELALTEQQFYAQGISLPSGADQWTLRKISFQTRSSGSGSFEAQLCRAASDGTPTSEALVTWIVNENDLLGWSRRERSPPTLLSGLSRYDNYCVVFKGRFDTTDVKVGTVGGTPDLWQSTDYGATWTQVSNTQLPVVAHVQPETSGTPLTLTHRRLTSVDVTLQSSESGLTRIETRVTLDNAPPLVGKAWRTDFNGNPTTQDRNGDGIGDFAWSGGTFAMNTIIDDVWRADGRLQADHADLVTTPIVVELRGETTSPGKGLLAGAIVRLTANEHADLSLAVALQADGTQTVQVLAFDGAATHVLTSVGNLPAEPLSMRLVVEPTRRLAALDVQGVDYPAVAFPVISSGVAASSFYITEDVSHAEYDYASFQITKPSS